MGIVNVTPDSFSDGGLFSGVQAAVDHALKLLEEGADIIDIGGESTRPGAEPVPLETELQRVIPVIEKLAARTGAQISVDTRKAAVMRAALAAGAQIVNDVSALQYDDDSLGVVARSNCPVVLMHGKGDPRNMQDNPQYEDVVGEVLEYLRTRARACEAAGIDRKRLIVDPGIGFGKNLHHNLALLAGLWRFAQLGMPVLLGVSRKRFIGALSGEAEPGKRLAGSLAAALHGVSQGVRFLRVHDVAATRQALDVWQAIDRSGKKNKAC